MCLIYFVVGSILGSFFCLCGERIPLHEPFLVSRSHCRHCGEKLAFWEMIPIFSALLLGFHCHHCHQRFSSLSCIVEFTYGLIFSFCLSQAEISRCILSLLWLTMAVLLTVTDLLYMTVDPRLFYLAAFFLWIANSYFQRPFYWESLLIIVGIVLLFLGKMRAKMGGGDLLLLLAWAPWLSPYELACFLLLASVLALLTFALSYLLKKPLKQLPFVPFLSLSLFFVKFF